MNRLMIFVHTKNSFHLNTISLQRLQTNIAFFLFFASRANDCNINFETGGQIKIWFLQLFFIIFIIYLSVIVLRKSFWETIFFDDLSQLACFELSLITFSSVIALLFISQR